MQKKLAVYRCVGAPKEYSFFGSDRYFWVLSSALIVGLEISNIELFQKKNDKRPTIYPCFLGCRFRSFKSGVGSSLMLKF